MINIYDLTGSEQFKTLPYERKQYALNRYFTDFVSSDKRFLSLSDGEQKKAYSTFMKAHLGEPPMTPKEQAAYAQMVEADTITPEKAEQYNKQIELGRQSSDVIDIAPKLSLPKDYTPADTSKMDKESKKQYYRAAESLQIAKQLGNKESAEHWEGMLRHYKNKDEYDRTGVIISTAGQEAVRKQNLEFMASATRSDFPLEPTYPQQQLTKIKEKEAVEEREEQFYEKKEQKNREQAISYQDNNRRLMRLALIKSSWTPEQNAEYGKLLKEQGEIEEYFKSGGLTPRQRDAIMLGSKAAKERNLASSMADAFFSGTLQFVTSPYTVFIPSSGISDYMYYYDMGYGSEVGAIESLFRGTVSSLPMNLMMMVNPAVGVALTMSSITSGGIKEDYEAGMLDAQTIMTNILSGAVQTAIEYMSADAQKAIYTKTFRTSGMKALQDAVHEDVKNVFFPTFKSFASAFGASAVEEGMEEIYQNVADRIIRATVNDEEMPDLKEWVPELAYEFAGGFLGAALTGTAFSAIQISQSKKMQQNITKYANQGYEYAKLTQNAIDAVNAGNYDQAFNLISQAQDAAREIGNPNKQVLQGIGTVQSAIMMYDKNKIVVTEAIIDAHEIRAKELRQELAELKKARYVNEDAALSRDARVLEIQEELVEIRDNILARQQSLVANEHVAVMKKSMDKMIEHIEANPELAEKYALQAAQAQESALLSAREISESDKAGLQAGISTEDDYRTAVDRHFTEGLADEVIEMEMKPGDFAPSRIEPYVYTDINIDESVTPKKTKEKKTDVKSEAKEDKEMAKPEPLAEDTLKTIKAEADRAIASKDKANLQKAKETLDEALKENKDQRLLDIRRSVVREIVNINEQERAVKDKEKAEVTRQAQEKAKEERKADERKSRKDKLITKGMDADIEKYRINTSQYKNKSEIADAIIEREGVVKAEMKAYRSKLIGMKWEQVKDAARELKVPIRGTKAELTNLLAIIEAKEVQLIKDISTKETTSHERGLIKDYNEGMKPKVDEAVQKISDTVQAVKDARIDLSRETDEAKRGEYEAEISKNVKEIDSAIAELKSIQKEAGDNYIAVERIQTEINRLENVARPLSKADVTQKVDVNLSEANEMIDTRSVEKTGAIPEAQMGEIKDVKSAKEAYIKARELTVHKPLAELEFTLYEAMAEQLAPRMGLTVDEYFAKYFDVFTTEAPTETETEASEQSIEYQLQAEGEVRYQKSKTAPKKVVQAYRMGILNEDGTLSPVMVDTKTTKPRYEIGQWYDAEVRKSTMKVIPGFHFAETPSLSQLYKKDGTLAKGRVYYIAEYSADKSYQAEADAAGGNLENQIPTDGYYFRGKMGKGGWAISGKMRPVRILSMQEVDAINRKAGIETINGMPIEKYNKMQAKTRYQVPKYVREIMEVRKKYEGTDKWMKAPNGKPTNLTERQWIHVQTESFKEWFGNSKVVDENGEPLVVYHGIGGVEGIDRFDPFRLGLNTGSKSAEKGFFFAKDRATADAYANATEQAYDIIREAGRGIKSLIDIAAEHGISDAMHYQYAIDMTGFIIDESTIAKDPEAVWNAAETVYDIVESIKREIEYRIEDGEAIDAEAAITEAELTAEWISNQATEDMRNIEELFLSIEDPATHDYEGEQFRDKNYADVLDSAIKAGKDGAILKNTYDGAGETDIFVAFENTQIKSATDNIGAYGRDTNLIRMQETVQETIKGYIQKLANGKYRVGFINADVTTGLHEQGHFGKDMLYVMAKIDPAWERYVKIAEEFCGVGEDGVWTTNAEEKFANGYVKYITEGKAPTPQLKTVFEKIKDLISKVVSKIAEIMNIELTDDIREVYGALLGAEITTKEDAREAKVDAFIAKVDAADFASKDVDVLTKRLDSEFGPQSRFITDRKLSRGKVHMNIIDIDMGNTIVNIAQVDDGYIVNGFHAATNGDAMDIVNKTINDYAPGDIDMGEKDSTRFQMPSYAREQMEAVREKYLNKQKHELTKREYDGGKSEGFSKGMIDVHYKGKAYHKGGSHIIDMLLDWLKNENRDTGKMDLPSMSTLESIRLFNQHESEIVVEFDLNHDGAWDSKDADAGKYYGYDELRISAPRKDALNSISRIILSDDFYKYVMNTEDENTPDSHYESQEHREWIWTLIDPSQPWYRLITKASDSGLSAEFLNFDDGSGDKRDAPKYKESWLKAPNGKPTNLSERQWLQVRTPSFKAWFGDWENDPKNASKVVDENGEPRVVYHGSRSIEGFTEFHKVSFFTDDIKTAEIFKTENAYTLQVNSEVIGMGEQEVKDITGFIEPYLDIDWHVGWDIIDAYQDNPEFLDPLKKYLLKNYSIKEDIETLRIDEVEKDVMDVFLNIRNPKVKDYGGRTWGETDTVIEHDFDMSKDGFIAKNIVEGGLGVSEDFPVSTTYVAFDPNQIKSATDNVGSYDPSTPDIRYQKSDAYESEQMEVRRKYEGTDKWMKAPNGKPTNLTERQWIHVRTESFKSWFGDWENDPKNASKVVDENGEPLAVWHGTKEGGFTIFAKEKLGSNTKSPSAHKGHFFAGKESTSASIEYIGEVALETSSALSNTIEMVENAAFYATEMLSEIEARGYDDGYSEELDLDIRKAAYEYSGDHKGYEEAIVSLVENIESDLNYNIDNLLEHGYSQHDIDEAIKSLKQVSDIVAGIRTDFSFGESGESMYNVFLNVRNPIEHDYFGRNRGRSFNEIIDEGSNAGNDGAIFKRVRDGGDIDNIYVAFDNTQIKSATDNVGSYDPSTPDIRYQKSDAYEKKQKFIQEQNETNAKIIREELDTAPSAEKAKEAVVNAIKRALMINHEGAEAMDVIKRQEIARAIKKQQKLGNTEAVEKLKAALELMRKRDQRFRDILREETGFMNINNLTLEQALKMLDRVDPVLYDRFVNESTRKVLVNSINLLESMGKKGFVYDKNTLDLFFDYFTSEHVDTVKRSGLSTLFLLPQRYLVETFGKAGQKLVELAYLGTAKRSDYEHQYHPSLQRIYDLQMTNKNGRGRAYRGEEIDAIGRTILEVDGNSKIAPENKLSTIQSVLEKWAEDNGTVINKGDIEDMYNAKQDIIAIFEGFIVEFNNSPIAKLHGIEIGLLEEYGNPRTYEQASSTEPGKDKILHVPANVKERIATDYNAKAKHNTNLYEVYLSYATSMAKYMAFYELATYMEGNEALIPGSGEGENVTIVPAQFFRDISSIQRAAAKGALKENGYVYKYIKNVIGSNETPTSATRMFDALKTITFASTLVPSIPMTILNFHQRTLIDTQVGAEIAWQVRKDIKFFSGRGRFDSEASPTLSRIMDMYRGADTSLIAETASAAQKSATEGGRSWFAKMYYKGEEFSAKMLEASPFSKAELGNRAYAHLAGIYQIVTQTAEYKQARKEGMKFRQAVEHVLANHDNIRQAAIRNGGVVNAEINADVNPAFAPQIFWKDTGVHKYLMFVRYGITLAQLEMRKFAAPFLSMKSRQSQQIYDMLRSGNIQAADHAQYIQAAQIMLKMTDERARSKMLTEGKIDSKKMSDKRLSIQEVESFHNMIQQILDESIEVAKEKHGDVIKSTKTETLEAAQMMSFTIRELMLRTILTFVISMLPTWRKDEKEIDIIAMLSDLNTYIGLFQTPQLITDFRLGGAMVPRLEYFHKDKQIIKGLTDWALRSLPGIGILNNFVKGITGKAISDDIVDAAYPSKQQKGKRNK